jgi:hypothetical protein
MEKKTFSFGFADLGLNTAGIEEVIGFNDNAEREYVASIIDEVLHEAEKITEIKAEYRIFDNAEFDPEERSIILSGQNFNVGKIVFSQIKKSGAAALFLCTAGPDIGLKSKKAMKEGDLLTGYIFDVAGSEIVEAATDLLQEDLRKSAEKEGLKITNRYSPGYCGWNVAEQHKLFTLLPGNYCGIKLTPSALMDPVKSVSGIIGIGKSVRNNPYTCKMCDMKDCIYRRVREKIRNG